MLFEVNVLVVLQGSMIYDTNTSNTFIDIIVVNPADHFVAGSSCNVLSSM